MNRPMAALIVALVFVAPSIAATQDDKNDPAYKPERAADKGGPDDLQSALPKRARW